MARGHSQGADLDPVHINSQMSNESFGVIGGKHPSLTQLLRNIRSSDLGDKLTLLIQCYGSLDREKEDAGRYVEDGCYIDCSGQGVELVEAKVNGSLDQLVSMSQEPDPNLLNKLSTFPVCLEDSPLSVIQVNKFEDGGLAICLRLTHRVVDFCSTIAFIDAWTKICHGSNAGEVVPPPHFGLSSIFPPKSSLANYSFPLSIFNEKLVMRKFAVSGKTLAQLAIETVSDELDMKLEGYRRPSRMEIVLALLCKALVKINRAKNPHARRTAVSFPMNLRGRMSTMIPDTGFGNIYSIISDTLSKGDEESDLHGYIKMLHETMKKAKARYRAVGSAEELWSMVEEDNKSIVRILMSGEHCIVTCTSWCGFPIYGIDFGWGGPEMAMFSRPPFRHNVLMDRKGDGGIDAWVVLDEEEMAKFKEDQDIIEHCLF
ncbi:hypothetical protein MLD38_022947 [Melastoma candidum]|uniref:Uncharacterized protein n=1 Tax=Melastoma candidum TaxID=119954 RepID=A0ACB9QKA4_9MYRT|nr:hypothetical protein MLD38_022947 [Melastoma candidum]